MVLDYPACVKQTTSASRMPRSGRIVQMPKSRSARAVGILGTMGVALCLTPHGRGGGGPPAHEPMTLHARVRVPLAASGSATNGSSSGFATKDEHLRWDPTKTAIII